MKEISPQPACGEGQGWGDPLRKPGQGTAPVFFGGTLRSNPLRPKMTQDIAPRTRRMAAIYQGHGVTIGERRLGQILKASFLDYWTVVNPTKITGSQKTELCDALVVCGDYLLVFQHKQIGLTLGAEPVTGWGKWARKSFGDATKQLIGARKVLENPQPQLFLDPKCDHPLHLKIPKWNPKRCFLIAAVGDSAEAANAWFGNQETTFCVCSSTGKTDQPLLEQFDDVAFLPQGDHGGNFVHVFEDRSLALLLQELDTIGDFCNYLEKRQEFFKRQKGLVATSEAELLWLYSRGMGPDGNHDFILPKEYLEYDQLLLDDGSWDDFCETKEWKAKKTADATSYLWDSLIRRFTKNKLAGTGTHWGPEGEVQHEGGIRYLALETRFIRRYLSNRLLEAFEKCPKGGMHKSLIPATAAHIGSGATYVILQLSVPRGCEYDRYRRARRQLLLEHIWAAKVRWPSAETIVGIAFEPPKHFNNELSSEDMLLVEAEYWTTENLSIAAESACETKFFSHAQGVEVMEKEFPVQSK